MKKEEEYIDELPKWIENKLDIFLEESKKNLADHPMPHRRGKHKEEMVTMCEQRTFVNWFICPTSGYHWQDYYLNIATEKIY